MKIILINGQPGAGKSSVGRMLMQMLENSAHVDADSLVATDPWEFGSRTDALAMDNALSLAENFRNNGFQYLVISGLCRNQELLDAFASRLPNQTIIFFVWLNANVEIRKSRKEKRARDEADTEGHFQVVDAKYPNMRHVEIDGGRVMFIDTSVKIAGEAAADIKKEVQNSDRGKQS